MTDYRDNPTVDFQGGLGDFFHRIYTTDAMEFIDNATDMVNIINLTFSPSVRDFFEHHPNAKNFILFDMLPQRKCYYPDYMGPRMRDRVYRHLGIPTERRVLTNYSPPHVFRKGLPLKLYRPDFHFVKRPVPIKKDKSVVVQLGASKAEKVIRWSKITDVLRWLVDSDVDVIVVGTGREPKAVPHGVRLVFNQDATLVADLVRRCSAFVGSHSSFLRLAWLEDKPSVCLYPDGFRDWGALFYIHSWGRFKDNTLNCSFSEADQPIILEFLHESLSNIQK